MNTSIEHRAFYSYTLTVRTPLLWLHCLRKNHANIHLSWDRQTRIHSSLTALCMLALHELCMLSAFVHTVSDGCLVDSETPEDLALWYRLRGLWKLTANVLINTTNLLLGNAELQQQLHNSE